MESGLVKATDCGSVMICQVYKGLSRHSNDAGYDVVTVYFVTFLCVSWMLSSTVPVS